MSLVCNWSLPPKCVMGRDFVKCGGCRRDIASQDRLESFSFSASLQKQYHSLLMNSYSPRSHWPTGFRYPQSLRKALCWNTRRKNLTPKNLDKCGIFVHTSFRRRRYQSWAIIRAIESLQLVGDISGEKQPMQRSCMRRWHSCNFQDTQPSVEHNLEGNLAIGRKPLLQLELPPIVFLRLPLASPRTISGHFGSN